MRWLVCGVCVGLLGCGGSPTDPKAPDAPDNSERGSNSDPGAEFSSSAEMGALDKAAVKSAVGEVMRKVSRCVDNGRKNLPFLGGEVEVFVQVNKSGQATVAFLERTTLGDHTVERCIVDAFRSRQWPRPIGGEVGEISQGFDFTAGHVDMPLDWSEDQLRSAMRAEGGYDELLGKLRTCRSDAGAGPLDVTMYLDEDGLVRAAGVAMRDHKGQKAVSCVVTTVQTTSFPAPKDNFAKVTVAVQ